jgi:hypothetical protein
MNEGQYSAMVATLEGSHVHVVDNPCPRYYAAAANPQESMQLLHSAALLVGPLGGYGCRGNCSRRNLADRKCGTHSVLGPRVRRYTTMPEKLLDCLEESDV